MSLRPYVHVDTPLDARGAGDELVLGPDVRHHLTRVLRLSPGSPVELADGAGGHAPATLSPLGARLSAPPTHTPARPPALVLAQAVPKARKLDEVVRTATELGVDHLVPVLSARCVGQPGGGRLEGQGRRWSAIARAAAEQARRPHRPVVHPPVPLAQLPGAIGALDGPGRERPGMIVAVPGAPPLPSVVDPAWRRSAAIAVVVGPEGGLDDDEVALLTAAGARPAGLGPAVLRTEHAGAAALAVLGAVLGRWDPVG